MTPTKGRGRGSVVIRELKSPDDFAFAAAHGLLRRHFKAAEMLPLRAWRNLLGERRQGLWTDVNWHVMVAQRGAHILGAASGSYLGNVNMGFVGYIAVRREARSRGIGPRLRRALARCFIGDARRIAREPLVAIVGEVRRENPWLRHLAERQGIIALDFPYIQPSLGGARRPVPLVLYYQPMRRPRTSLAATEVRKLLYTMWRRMYRVSRPLESREFRGMLKSLEGRRLIRGIKAKPPGDD